MIYYPLIRLKNCLSKPLTYGLNEPAVEDNPEWPRYIRITDFDDNDCLRDETFKSLPPEIAEAGLLKKGDILLARSGATVGKAFHFNEDIKACYAGYLIRARFNEKTIIPKFFSYITKSVYYSDWKNRINIQATIQNISAEKYYQFEFPCPQLDIQQRIVDYLDEKTKAIDARISVLEKKSDAYTRLKASVINRAVTRGLNPNVSLKDSGIEWIGMIPEHWEVKRMKDVSFIYKELVEDKVNSYELLSLTLKGIIKRDESGKGKYPSDFSTYQVVMPGDLIFCLFDMDETPRTIGLSTYTGMITGAYTALKVNENYVSNNYLYYRYLNIDNRKSLKPYYTSLRKVVRTNTFMSIKLPLPPLSEQQSIATYLDTKCSEIDKAIDNLGKQIDALKRLKRSLINEVVTGKRKVL